MKLREILGGYFHSFTLVHYFYCVDLVRSASRLRVSGFRSDLALSKINLLAHGRGLSIWEGQRLAGQPRKQHQQRPRIVVALMDRTPQVALHLSEPRPISLCTKQELEKGLGLRVAQPPSNHELLTPPETAAVELLCGANVDHSRMMSILIGLPLGGKHLESEHHFEYSPTITNL